MGIDLEARLLDNVGRRRERRLRRIEEPREARNQGGRPGDPAPDLHGIPLAQPEQLGMLDRVSPPERQRLTEQRTKVGEELAAHLRAW